MRLMTVQEVDLDVDVSLGQKCANTLQWLALSRTYDEIRLSRPGILETIREFESDEAWNEALQEAFLSMQEAYHTPRCDHLTHPK